MRTSWHWIKVVEGDKAENVGIRQLRYQTAILSVHLGLHNIDTRVGTGTNEWLEIEKWIATRTNGFSVS